MAEIIDVRLPLDEINKQLDALDARFKKTQAQAEKATGAGVDGFAEMQEAIKKAESETEKYKKELVQLQQELKKLKAAQKTTENTNGQKALNAEIAKLNEIIKRQVKEQAALNAKLKDAQKIGSQGVQNLKKQNNEAANVTKTMRGLAPVITAAFAADLIVKFTKEIGRMAIEIQQLDQKAKIVFGEALPMVTRESEKAANAIGLTAREFRSAAAGVAAILAPLGFTRTQAAKTAVEVTKLAGAISNWSGGQFTAAEATKILQQSLVGQTEGLRAIGLVIDQTSPQYRLRIKEIMETQKVTLEQAKAMDILAQITQKSEDAQTAFADGTENMAVKLSQANARVREANESFAEFITPAQVSLINGYATDVGNFSKVLSSNMSTFEKTGLVLRELVFGIFGDSKMDTVVARMDAFKLRLEEIANTGAVDELRAMNEQLREELGLVEKQEEAQRGLLEVLLEQRKALDDDILKATTQDEINRLVAERAAKEEEINMRLGKRKNLIKTNKDAVVEETKAVTDLDKAWADAFAAGSEAGFLERFQEQYDADLLLQAENLAKKQENERKFSDWKFNLDMDSAMASAEIAGNLANTLSTLFGKTAQDAKTLAAFEASIGAALAIVQVLSGKLPANPILRAALAVSIGLRAFAQVAKINSTPVPSFYEGTDYLQRGNNPKGRDTIPVMAHEGEAIIRSGENRKAPGLAKAWNAGKLDEWIRVTQVEPILRKQKMHAEQQKAAMIATAMGGVFTANLNDGRIIRQLKNIGYIGEEQIEVLKRSQRRRNPYRA